MREVSLIGLQMLGWVDAGSVWQYSKSASHNAALAVPPAPSPRLENDPALQQSAVCAHALKVAAQLSRSTDAHQASPVVIKPKVCTDCVFLHELVTHDNVKGSPNEGIEVYYTGRWGCCTPCRPSLAP